MIIMRLGKILRLSLMMFLIHASADTFSQKTDSLKCWCENDRLKWDDFKGKIPNNGDSSFLSAGTGYRLVAIPIEKNDVLSYDIKIVFKKYESWTIDTTAEYLLAHEQLHFDIAELYARKLRKGIQDVSKTNRNPTEEVFKPVIQKLYLETANTQRKYDEETIHGIITESQIEWEKKIALELKKLQKYVSTPADCQLN
jgi:hypothetical protein